MDERVRRTRDILLGELDKINQKGSLTSESLSYVDKIIDILKDVHEMDPTIADNYNGMPRYYYGNTRDRGYVVTPYHENHYGAGKSEMIEHLQRALDMAQTEQERDSIRRMIEQAR